MMGGWGGVMPSDPAAYAKAYGAAVSSGSFIDPYQQRTDALQQGYTPPAPPPQPGSYGTPVTSPPAAPSGLNVSGNPALGPGPFSPIGATPPGAPPTTTFQPRPGMSSGALSRMGPTPAPPSPLGGMNPTNNVAVGIPPGGTPQASNNLVMGNNLRMGSPPGGPMGPAPGAAGVAPGAVNWNPNGQSMNMPGGSWGFPVQPPGMMRPGVAVPGGTMFQPSGRAVSPYNAPAPAFGTPSSPSVASVSRTSPYGPPSGAFR